MTTASLPIVPLLAYLIIMVQVLGLLAACLARRSEGSPHQTVCQYLFLGLLLLVGAVAVGSAAFLGPGWWLSSGTTLSVMTLGATAEFGRPPQLTRRRRGSPSPSSTRPGAQTA